MKKLILIIAIVFSGMLMQAQEIKMCSHTIELGKKSNSNNSYDYIFLFDENPDSVFTYGVGFAHNGDCNITVSAQLLITTCDTLSCTYNYTDTLDLSQHWAGWDCPGALRYPQYTIVGNPNEANRNYFVFSLTNNKLQESKIIIEITLSSGSCPGVNIPRYKEINNIYFKKNNTLPLPIESVYEHYDYIDILGRTITKPPKFGVYFERLRNKELRWKIKKHLRI